MVETNSGSSYETYMAIMQQVFVDFRSRAHEKRIRVADGLWGDFFGRKM